MAVLGPSALTFAAFLVGGLFSTPALAQHEHHAPAPAVTPTPAPQPSSHQHGATVSPTPVPAPAQTPHAGHGKHGEMQMTMEMEQKPVERNLFQSDMTLMTGMTPRDPMAGMAIPGWHLMLLGVARLSY